MARVSIGRLELEEGTMRAVRTADGRYLLLVRLDGRLRALDDLCNHAGCLLSRGRLEKGRVVCPCHLMQFDVKTGKLLSIPRLCEDQPIHPVEERGGEVFVTLPD
jgi:3-phenylpropionate/trans-cinnamate dioxygenase ferredoxin subunit